MRTRARTPPLPFLLCLFLLFIKGEWGKIFFFCFYCFFMRNYFTQQGAKSDSQELFWSDVAWVGKSRRVSWPNRAPRFLKSRTVIFKITVRDFWPCLGSFVIRCNCVWIKLIGILFLSTCPSVLLVVTAFRKPHAVFSLSSFIPKNIYTSIIVLSTFACVCLSLCCWCWDSPVTFS